METLGRLKTIVASIEGENGLPLDDVPETLQWCIETIERLQKERDEGWAEALRVQTERDAALAEVERLKGEVKWWKREAATGQDNVNFITQQERDWR